MWAPSEDWGHLSTYFQLRELKALILPSDLRNPSRTQHLPSSRGRWNPSSGQQEGTLLQPCPGEPGSRNTQHITPPPTKSSPRKLTRSPACSAAPPPVKPTTSRIPPACLPACRGGCLRDGATGGQPTLLGKLLATKSPTSTIQIQDSERRREGTKIGGKPSKAKGNPTSSLSRYPGG